MDDLKRGMMINKYKVKYLKLRDKCQELERRLEMKEHLKNWIHDDHGAANDGKGHYHCKKCSGMVTPVGRIRWGVAHGVRHIGVCTECNMILIENERGERLQWIKI